MTTDLAIVRQIQEKCTRIHYLKPNKPGHEVIRFYPKTGLKLTEKETALMIVYLHEQLPSVKPGEITAEEIVGTNHIAININDVDGREIFLLKKMLPETKPTV